MGDCLASIVIESEKVVENKEDSDKVVKDALRIFQKGFLDFAASQAYMSAL